MLNSLNDSTTFDELLIQWISEVVTLPHKSVYRILQEEIGALNAGEGNSEELQPRRDALEQALNALKLRPDPSNLRQAAISLTTTIDLSTLYSLLDTNCTLIIVFGTQRSLFHGIEDVIEELCQQQESIFCLRDDASTLSEVSNIVQGVSPVQAWVHQPQPGMGISGCRCQVGTLVTYFEDYEQTSPLFSLQTLVSFTPDGLHADHVERILLVEDASIEVIQPNVHFGSFLRKKGTA